jgi:hypothetical protein
MIRRARAPRLAAVSLAFALPALALPRSARGANEEAAAAQTLFDDAKARMARGEYGEACPELEASQKIDPGVGTLLNLADCYQHTHRLRSAWATFLDAANAAHREGEKEREVEARARAALLAPRLSRMVVRAPGAPAGLVLSRDGASIAPSELGVPVPVDEGTHSVEASAPGHRRWKMLVPVVGEATVVTVTVPPLDAPRTAAAEPVVVTSGPATAPPAAEPIAAVEPVRESSSGLGTSRTLAIVSWGAAAAGFVTGGVFLADAISENADANRACPTSSCPEGAAVAQSQAATRDANIATASLVVGAVAAAAGAVLWLTGRPSANKAASLELRPGLGAIELRGTW